MLQSNLALDLLQHGLGFFVASESAVIVPAVSASLSRPQFFS
jgi:hypothetical protein